MRIKFMQKEAHPNSIQILLDGKDITNSVKDFKFNASAGSVSTVILELIPDSIDMESDNFKLTTQQFTIQDLLQVIKDEGAIYVKNKVVKEILNK